MARRIDPGEPTGRGPGNGRAYVYVLPCAYEDILKLGFSRDPLGRMRQLHPRWFDFFDLDAGFLIQTETVRDARDVELGLANAIAEHNAPAPLVIRRQAGGHTEWYRGAHVTLSRAADALAAGGYVRHAPLRGWVRDALLAHRDGLFAWSLTVLTVDDLDGVLAMDGQPTAAQRTVRDALDAFAALDIPLASALSPPVLDWYLRASSYR